MDRSKDLRRGGEWRGEDEPPLCTTAVAVAERGGSQLVSKKIKKKIVFFSQSAV